MKTFSNNENIYYFVPLLFNVMYVSLYIILRDIKYKVAKWLKNLWKSHIDHHYRDSNKGYGVSSSFWDRIFGTRQAERKSAG